MKDKFAIIVAVHHPISLRAFLEYFYSKEAGEDYDLFFVHNKFGCEEPKTDFDKAKVTYRTEEQIKEVCDMLDEEKEKHPDTVVYEREDRGRDFGAYRYGYLKVKGQYKYYCFLNTRTIIMKDQWLSYFLNEFRSEKDIGATGPQLCLGIKYPLCYRGLYWAQTDEAIKTMNWWEPKSRTDAHTQEMELIYPHVVSAGYSCSQFGSGNDILTSDLTEILHPFPFTAEPSG